MRIAVIDDEKYSRVALVRQIENFLPHAEIFEARSGAQAVELLEKHTFDILFLDIHLGDMEGYEIATLRYEEMLHPLDAYYNHYTAEEAAEILRKLTPPGFES